jgi:hypothetical protein
MPMYCWPGRPEGRSPVDMCVLVDCWLGRPLGCSPSGECVCLWITGLAGLRGMVPVEIVNACGLLAWQALGAWPGRDHECLWITGLAILRGSAWERGDNAGLCKPSRCGPSGAEIMNACGLPAWQALEAQPSEDHECLWITSLAVIRGMAWHSGDCAGLCRLWGHGPSGSGDRECLWMAGLSDLRGAA